MKREKKEWTVACVCVPADKIKIRHSDHLTVNILQTGCLKKNPKKTGKLVFDLFPTKLQKL